MKGLSYSVVEWPPPMQVPMQRLIFGARTVPALRIDGEKIQGSRAIMRRLDELVPEPPLLPSDPERRAQVLEAERWGDEVFQPIARELIWAGLVHKPDAMVSYSEHSRLPLPAPAVKLIAPGIARLGRRVNKTSDAIARKDLSELPGAARQDRRMDRRRHDRRCRAPQCGRPPAALDGPADAHLRRRAPADRGPSVRDRPRARCSRTSTASFRPARSPRRSPAREAQCASGGPTRLTSCPGPRPARASASRRSVAGQRQLRIELQQRHEHEPPRADLGVRKRQPRRGILDRSEQQHIHIDHARPVPGAPGGAADDPLDLLARVEQLLRSVRGLHAHARVQEVRLVEHQPNRFGLVHRGGCEHLDSVRPERRNRSLQIRTPLADVRSEAEVARPNLRGGHCLLRFPPDLDRHLTQAETRSAARALPP